MSFFGLFGRKKKPGPPVTATGVVRDIPAQFAGVWAASSFAEAVGYWIESARRNDGLELLGVSTDDPSASVTFVFAHGSPLDRVAAFMALVMQILPLAITLRYELAAPEAAAAGQADDGRTFDEHREEFLAECARAEEKHR